MLKALYRSAWDDLVLMMFLPDDLIITW